jgi:hypothetical protein
MLRNTATMKRLPYHDQRGWNPLKLDDHTWRSHSALGVCVLWRFQPPSST